MTSASIMDIAELPGYARTSTADVSRRFQLSSRAAVRYVRLTSMQRDDRDKSPDNQDENTPPRG